MVLFIEDTNTMQSFLIALRNNEDIFGIRFSPFKCKVLLQDLHASSPELVIGIECIDHFTYLESFISTNGLVSDEISARIQEAQLTFANSCRL